jgi:drug/metabolite transporter superfamily protein YnfA
MKSGVIFKSILLFIVAGILEIGGGYLVWLWLRDRRGFLLGVIGGLVLFLYLRRIWGSIRRALSVVGLVDR